MDPRVAPLQSTLRLNTRLLLNCLDGLDEDAGSARPNERTNSIGFIAAHLVDARHLLARVIGLAAPPPYAGVLESARTIDDVAVVPSLAETRIIWGEISERVDAALPGLTTEALDAPAPQRYPLEDRTVLGAIAFLMHTMPTTSGSLPCSGNSMERRRCGTGSIGCWTRHRALC